MVVWTTPDQLLGRSGTPGVNGAMRRLLALGIVALALLLAAPAAPAQAHGKRHHRHPVTPSVQIRTSTAVAVGDYYYDEFAEAWVFFRPVYPVVARVRCPAGAQGALGYSPVWGNTIPGVDFTCRGKRQRVTFGAVGAVPNELGWSRQRPVATLYVNGVAVDTATRKIRVESVAR